MHSYGYIPDQRDQNDHPYAANPRIARNLPVSVDLRAHCPPVYDQLALGSCTANAIAAAIEYNQIKQGLPGATPSRLFVYYNERVIEHSVLSDNGAMIRDGIKSVHRQGACSEAEWPYDASLFAQKPPERCYMGAKQHLVTSYQRIPRSLTQMQACLASGEPFVFGFSVYSSFESDEVASTGVAPMPAANEELLGGHACLAVGYQTDKQVWLCRNSWGSSWGMDGGYFTLPFAYLLSSSLSGDFWVIKSIE